MSYDYFLDCKHEEWTNSLEGSDEEEAYCSMCEEIVQSNGGCSKCTRSDYLGEILFHVDSYSTHKARKDHKDGKVKKGERYTKTYVRTVWIEDGCKMSNCKINKTVMR